MNVYHILNGDALKDHFPSGLIPGECIVARECMVDGPVNERRLDDLFRLRSNFIHEAYGLENYFEVTVPELNKIAAIRNAEVNLWFEKDLFCQVNLWFACSLLYLNKVKVALVIPENTLELGFGGLNASELAKAYQKRTLLSQVNVNQFTSLWFAYQKDHIERLLKLGVQMHAQFPFVMEAIRAHFERLPNEERPGKPEQIIRAIIAEKSTNDFDIIFNEFHRRAPIYGFGDLQVKRIFDAIRSKESK